MRASPADPYDAPETIFPLDPGQPAPVARPSVRFMLSHPAHWLALGFGSGLSRIAPGTSGTLWAWIAFIALTPWMTEARWAVL
ncbi:MAG: phosphatidylglycerophosphatase A, partial [Burkholderiales bacterium]